MAQGYLSLVLHAHLPFVRHPEQAEYLEERWLFEAVAESYLPLLVMLDRLKAEAVPFRLTLSISPTLMAMLDDLLLRERCRHYLEAGVRLAEREVTRAAGLPEEVVTHFYRHRTRRLLGLYTRTYSQDLLSAFSRLAQAGYLELITSSATHGFLPLLCHQPEAVRTQVLVAVHAFEQRFGFRPRGFWLPECGYFPGVDRVLSEAGVEYCFVETHGLTRSNPGAPRGPYAHAWTPGGIAIFARDPASSRQVWSADEGYPGDPAYRDFYRDIGFEREPAHLGALAGPPGIRTFTGFKYHAVTGSTDRKALYDPARAEWTAARHASHFYDARLRQLAELGEQLPSGPPPLVVAPYDAELFGHWWFEGPLFLERLARIGARRGEGLFITPGEYLRRFPLGQGVLQPALSSWGYRGYADFWCDGANHWIYRHLTGASRRMTALARSHPRAHGQLRRVLNQALRELLLAQASDWAFLMRTGTAAEYARCRQEAHLAGFRQLTRDPLQADPARLRELELANNIFPDVNYEIHDHG